MRILSYNDSISSGEQLSTYPSLWCVLLPPQVGCKWLIKPAIHFDITINDFQQDSYNFS